MEKNILLTRGKNWFLIIVVVLALLVLGGCGNHTSPIDSSSTGFFDQYFVYSFSLLIKKVASWLYGNYALAIVAITLGIRFVLMPFFIQQAKNSKESQHKMAVIKPEMDAIQEKYKGKKDAEDRLKMQEELSSLYKKHDFNPMKMAAGCLPLIIQMPFLIGFYYAIRRTPEIAEQSFLWFQLGEVDFIFVGVAVIIYYIQAKVSLIGLTEAQGKQMAIMALLSPVMIGIVSLNVPAALPLYWAVSGLFIIVQTVIIKRLIH